MPRRLGDALGFLLGLWLAFALLIPLVSGRAAAAEDAESRAMEAQLHRRVNAVRAARNLIPLERDARLDAVARAHSEDMAERRYLSHQSPEGRSPLDRILASGVDEISLAAENAGQTDRADVVHEIVEGWLASPAHRRNLLAPVFNGTGIGAAQRADGTWLVTQVYVTRPR